MTKNSTLVLALLFVLIVWVPVLYILENSGTNLAGFHFWLRVLIGGWPVADVGRPETSVEFSFAITLALLLRLGPLLLLFEMAIVILKGREDQKMNIAQSLVLRDRSIKNSILTQFSEAERESVRIKIETAFKAGNSIWEDKHLITALGKDAAEKLKETLKSEIS